MFQYSGGGPVRLPPQGKFHPHPTRMQSKPVRLGRKSHPKMADRNPSTALRAGVRPTTVWAIGRRGFWYLWSAVSTFVPVEREDWRILMDALP